MSVSALSSSNAALQSIARVQSPVKSCHGGNDNDADDGGANAAPAATPGGFMASLLQSLQQVLTTQAPTSAATGTGPTDSATAASTGTGASKNTIAATAAKDLGNFLQILFQAIRASTNPASTGSTTATDSSAAATAAASSTDTSAATPAAVDTAAATAAAATASANTSSSAAVDSNATQSGGHHHHRLGAYRSHLVSGLESVLQQLKSGSTDASAGSTPSSSALSGLTTSFQTLLQDLSGAQGGTAASAGGATSSAALQSFLTDLIGGLQANGKTVPTATGNIISTTA
jgi:hypothetical protein